MSIFKRRLSKREKLNKTKREWSGWGVFDALNLYSRILADLWTKGRTDNPTDKLEGEEVLGDNNFYYSVNRIFTTKGVRKPFFIQLPMEVTRGFVTDLRDDIDRAVNGFNQRNQAEEHVSVTSIADTEHFKIDLSEGRMRGRFRLWARQYERIMNESQDKRLEDVLDTDKHTEDTKHKVGSYLYMKEAVEEQKASFYKTVLIIELIATSDEILDEAERVLKANFYKEDIKTKEVFIQTNEYMRTFTPVVANNKTLLSQMNEGNVFADDTLSSLAVPTHGVIGDPTGDYHGVDVLSRRVVTFDMYKGSDVKNILLTAMSGEGKSNYAKMLYTFYSAKKQYGTVIFDYEGTEYRPLGNVTEADIISMTGSSGRYVNTMVIPDLTGDDEIDVDLKADAQNSTVRIFNLLVDSEYGMTELQESLLSDVMNEAYLDFGVTSEPESWYLSKDMTFFHIYMKLKDFMNKKDMSEKRDFHGEDIIQGMVATLSKFFEEGGLHKHWFKEPISIQEVLDKKNVIFSFGMGGQDESMVDEKAVALRQLFASHITSVMANHNIKNGIKTVVFVEEVQRYIKQRFSGEILARFTSGGRKNGLITYLITNSPSELINTEDNFMNDEIRENASTIIGNISMQIVGALLKNNMDDLIRTFGLDNARGVLYQLSEIAEGNTSDSGLRYCFFVRYKGQSGIVRMLAHPALDGLPLYETIDPSIEGDSDLRTVEHTDEGKILEGIDLAEKKDKDKKGETFASYMEDGNKNKGMWKRTDLEDIFKEEK